MNVCVNLPNKKNNLTQTMEFDFKWVTQVSIDHYTKLTHHVNSFNCSKCIFSRFYCCWIVDEKQLYFPSIWCKQTFCEEERCESRWPRFALSVTEWGGWHLPYMGVCIQFDTSKLTDICPNIFLINLKWPIPSGRVTEWFGWTMRVASAIHETLHPV